MNKILSGLSSMLSSNPHKRRRARQESARMSASLFGDFPISEDYKLWREDQNFLSSYKKLSPHNSYSQDRKFLLREFVRFTASVPGSMAECGCYEGASSYFMLEEAKDTHLFLFDSFEGLSNPTEADSAGTPSHPYWEPGALTASERKLRDTLNNFKNFSVLKGWIPERFPEVSNESFRLIHIDVDLYQPTLDSLNFFYPRLNKGGVIVLDDYGFTTCPGAFQATQEFMKDKSEHIIHSPTGQGIIIRSG